MSAISSDSPIGFRNTGHVRSKAFDLPNRKASSQKNGGKSQQMNSDMVKVFRQLRECTDVRLDYKVDNDGKKILVSVINKASEKIVVCGCVKML